MTQDAMARLEAANPVRPGPADVDARALADLRSIGSEAPQRRSMRWPRLMVAAAAVVVLACVAYVAVTPRAPVAVAATPQPLAFTGAWSDPTASLNQLISASRAAPSGLSGTGQVLFQQRRSWNYDTVVDGNRVLSHVVPQDADAWTRSDGTGQERVRSTFADHVEEDTSDFTDAPRYWQWDAPPTTLTALETDLAAGHPTSNGPAERLVALADASRAQPIDQTTRTLLLQYLADTPTLRWEGPVTTRSGRPGVAFGVDSDYSGLLTRYTVIFDADGNLIATEDQLQGDPGSLNVDPHAVLGYGEFLGTRWVQEVGQLG